MAESVCCMRVLLQLEQFADARIDEDMQFVQAVVKKGRSLKDAAGLTKAVPFVVVSTVCAY